MSKVYETLKKKNDPSVEVYPNIEAQNIPSNAIDTSKINDGAITTNKISDKAVTYNKLDTNIQDVVTRFNNIYDDEDDEMNVATINVSDDINTSNINISNTTKTYDLEVENDEIIVYGNPIKHLYKHIINCVLKDNNTNISSNFSMNIISTETSLPITFNDLLNLLKNTHCEKQIIMESGFDVPAYISSFDNDMINIYATNDGTINLHEYEYDELVSINGSVYLFN